jgi:hypothetical protein
VWACHPALSIPLPENEVDVLALTDPEADAYVHLGAHRTLAHGFLGRALRGGDQAMPTRESFIDRDFSRIDPLACLLDLSASFSKNPAELVPVRPDHATAFESSAVRVVVGQVLPAPAACRAVRPLETGSTGTFSQ